MSITNEAEKMGMQLAAQAVGVTLRQMRDYARPGMSTLELDEYGSEILRGFGAHSAPKLTYGFPGWTCISVNDEAAHGIPKATTILQEGDLVNIDVSAELGGYWADNGGSFVLGNDIHGHAPLVQASKDILREAIDKISHGVRLRDIGATIERAARRRGFTVLRNLTGHGIGRSLHEEPHEILNYEDPRQREKLRAKSVIAIETFISTKSRFAEEQRDGWTLKGNKGGFVAQHEHTVVVTEGKAEILTLCNGIWD